MSRPDSRAAVTTSLDAIIVGAGHNGLVAAAYLARAGLRVAVCERRAVVGGACVTEELAPGVFFSPCASVVSALRPEIIRELELKRFGLDLYAPDVSGFLMADDGSHVFMWPELDRTIKALDAIAGGDGDALVDFGLRMRHFARGMTPYLLREAPRLSEVVAGFEARGEIDLFHELFHLSVGEVADKYFRGQHIKGFLTFFGIISVFGGPYTPGTAYVLSHHSWGEFEGQFGRAGLARGGMGSVTRAMAACATAAGASVRLEAPVAEILVDKGRAAGVELQGGEVLEAPIVVSNADPLTTLLHLLDDSNVPAAVRQRVGQLDYRGSQGRVLLRTSALPHYIGFDTAEGPQNQNFTLLGGSIEAFEECWRAQSKGELADTYPLEVLVQSATDPSLAPAGQHTIGVGIQHLPYDLATGTWDSRRDELTAKTLETLYRYAPNLKSHIEETWTITPLDLERTYGLAKGNLFHGAMTPAQLFDSRPYPGSGGARTPIPGLYLCGAGTHPGGAVIGANGYNAAHMILSDHASEGSASARPRRSQMAKSTLARRVERIATKPSLRAIRAWGLRQSWLRPVIRAMTRTRQ